MTRAHIAHLVAELTPRPATTDGGGLGEVTELELEAAAEALAARLPATPWLIEERESALPGGRPTHHGTVVCNTRFARARLGLCAPGDR